MHDFVSKVDLLESLEFVWHLTSTPSVKKTTHNPAQKPHTKTPMGCYGQLWAAIGLLWATAMGCYGLLWATTTSCYGLFGPTTMVPLLGPSALVLRLWSQCYGPSAMVPVLWSQCYGPIHCGPSAMVPVLWSQCYGPSTMGPLL